MQIAARFALGTLFVAGFAAGALASDSATNANASAPVMVGSDIIAAIPLADAWSLIKKANDWPSWNKNVSAVTLSEGAASPASPSAEAGESVSPSATVSAAALAPGSSFSYVWQGHTITAAVDASADVDQFTWKGTSSGADVSLRWMLRATDASHTLVSLRAVLKPMAPSSLESSASAETQAWIGAVQSAVAKRPQPAPAAKPKKRHHKAPAASPAPTAGQ